MDGYMKAHAEDGGKGYGEKVPPYQQSTQKNVRDKGAPTTTLKRPKLKKAEGLVPYLYATYYEENERFFAELAENLQTA